MTISQMQYFHAVCEYGSISKASAVLHVSQPTISVSIKELESEFDLPLFLRENKQMILTQEGEFFREQVSILLSEFDRLAHHMSSLGKSNNEINLIMPVFSAAHLFTTFAESFSATRRDCIFKVHQGNAEASLKALECGTSDLAILVDNDPLPPKFESFPVLSTEFFYCVSSSHPLAGKDVVTMSDLCNEPLILNQEDSYMTKQVKQRFYDLGLAPKVLLYAVQLSLIENILVSGKAGTFLTKEVYQSLPDVVAIPLEQPIKLRYVLAWKATSYMNRNTRAFVEYIKEKCLESEGS